MTGGVPSCVDETFRWTPVVSKGLDDEVSPPGTHRPNLVPVKTKTPVGVHKKSEVGSGVGPGQGGPGERSQGEFRRTPGQGGGTRARTDLEGLVFDGGVTR